MDFAPHLLKVLARSTGGRVELTFHPPLTVVEAGNRKALAGAAEHAVRAGISEANPPGRARY